MLGKTLEIVTDGYINSLKKAFRKKAGELRMTRDKLVITLILMIAINRKIEMPE